MERNRIKIEVSVDLDPVPGWGNDPQDYVRLLQQRLGESIPHYHPDVQYVGPVISPDRSSEIGGIFNEDYKLLEVWDETSGTWETVDEAPSLDAGLRIREQIAEPNQRYSILEHKRTLI